MNTTPLPAAILVADDNPTDVFFLQRGLHAAGIAHPLQHMQDGPTALAWLERSFAGALDATSRPWLFFVDLKMPGMDGFAVLQHLQVRGWLERLTVAMLTTSDEPREIARAHALGAQHFLVKYPRPDVLARVVSAAERRFAPEAGLPPDVGSEREPGLAGASG